MILNNHLRRSWHDHVRYFLVGGVPLVELGSEIKFEI